MPFDGGYNDDLTINPKARLRLLKEIAAKSHGSQSSFRTCLWADVRRDHRLQMAGLYRYDLGEGFAPTRAVTKFFGAEHAEVYLFGSSPLPVKRQAIAALLGEGVPPPTISSLAVRVLEFLFVGAAARGKATP